MYLAMSDDTHKTRSMYTHPYIHGRAHVRIGVKYWPFYPEIESSEGASSLPGPSPLAICLSTCL